MYAILELRHNNNNNNKSSSKSFGKSALLLPHRRKHSPIACASCTLHNVQNHYGMLQNVMVHHSTLQSRYRTLQSVMECYGGLQDAVESTADRYRAITLCYGTVMENIDFSIRPRMHSSAAYASCTSATADESSYSADGTLHPHHFSPLTHRSIILTFTLNLTPLTVLIPLLPLPPPAGILQA